MDRQMVVNLIKNRTVECPKGTSRLWLVRRFEITARAGGVVAVDEYEACDVAEDAPAGMQHVGRSVIYLKENRVVEEAVERELNQAAKARPARRPAPDAITV